MKLSILALDNNREVKKMRNVSMIIWAVVLVLVVAGASRADLTGYVVCYFDSAEVYFTNFDTGRQTILGQGHQTHRIAFGSPYPISALKNPY